MNWFYVDGPHRLGPLSDSEWADLVNSGKIQPGTLVWHEGLPGWTPYAQVPPSLPEKPGAEAAPESPLVDAEEHESMEAWIARMLGRDYPVSIRFCLGRAWELLREHFWMLVGSTLLMTAITLVCVQFPGLDLLMGMALQGVLFAGLCNVYLRLMRGEPAVTADLFSGFDPRVFRHLTLKTLVTFLCTKACFIPLIFASKKTGVTLTNLESKLLADPHGALLFLLALMLCAIPAVYFSFIWMFALPLIIDKRLPFWPAMNLSRRTVMRHPWKVGLLTVVAGVVGAVGLIFTMPIYIGATLFLYEDIFSEPAPGETGEEPPSDPL